MRATQFQNEIEPTEPLADHQLVDRVESAIRTRPQDFPLLATLLLNVASMPMLPVVNC